MISSLNLPRIVFGLTAQFPNLIPLLAVLKLFLLLLCLVEVVTVSGPTGQIRAASSAGVSCLCCPQELRRSPALPREAQPLFPGGWLCCSLLSTAQAVCPVV